MQKSVHLVTTGAYSDYTVRAAFLEEAAAQAYADSLNRRARYGSDEAQVETYPLLPAGAMPVVFEIRETGINAADGSIVDEVSNTYSPMDDESRGQSHTTRARDMIEIRLRTQGDAACVPQAHSDAVAQARAEIIGL